MKSCLILFILSLAFTAFWACNEAPKNNPATVAQATVSQDSATIANVIYGFYQWYLGGNSGFPTNLPFITEKGKKFKIDEEKLKSWGVDLKKSGFVSDEYLSNVKDFFKNCESKSQNEADGPHYCIDADLFTCYSEDPALLIDTFTKSALDIKKQGSDRAIATMKGVEQFSFHLKLESGKWVLTNFGCIDALTK